MTAQRWSVGITIPGRRLAAVAISWAPVLLLAAGLALADDPSGGRAEDADDGRPAAGEPATTPPQAGDELPRAAEVELFERVRVVGRADAAERIPGSVTVIDRAELDRQDHDDIHRILTLAPGVSVQEEEGYGLRPNIGMRGTGVERSSKITLLEDGVPIAPAPYAAPAAYYFPTAGRMEGIEVRKGSASIQHGPYTNGGVLNLLSSSIPSAFEGRAELAIGGDDTMRGLVRAGDSGPRFGWLVETYQFDTEGFKQLDGGGDTGFDLEDYMVKLRYTSGPDAGVFQALELKLGTTRQEGQETYLGLTVDDFRATPYRRYAGSQVDRIDTDHDQVQLRYMVRPADWFDLTATVYDNDFFRNWHKLDSVLGVGIAEVLSNPQDNAAALDVLRADLSADSADDALTVRNNRRFYDSRGVQVLLGMEPQRRLWGTHELELGVRYHEDSEDRFQEDEDYRMTTGGQMVLTGADPRGSGANRLSSADAWALFVRDTITAGRWTVTPGVRYEMIDLRQVRWDDPSRTVVSADSPSEVDEVIPGVGAHYALSGRTGLFAGVHRGFAPPGPNLGEADSETSWNWEAGWRRRHGALRAEAVAFYNDYENLLAACTLSVGCDSAQVGDVFNGGEATVQGIEALVEYDLGAARELGFGLPLRLTATVTKGEFDNAFDSDYGPWGSVQVGDELPYLPEYQAALSAGLVRDRWSVHGQFTWTDAMRTRAGRGPLDPTDSTDEHFLVDLSGSYELGRGLEAFVHVRNLTDEVYVAAQRPAGLRPGIDRTVLAGLGLDF